MVERQNLGDLEDHPQAWIFWSRTEANRINPFGSGGDVLRVELSNRATLRVSTGKTAPAGPVGVVCRVWSYMKISRAYLARGDP